MRGRIDGAGLGPASQKSSPQSSKDQPVPQIEKIWPPYNAIFGLLKIYIRLYKALGRAMHRPSFLPAPGFVLKLILGEFGSVLLEGQRVIPKKLLDNGYVFTYPEIDGALRSLIMD